MQNSIKVLSNIGKITLAVLIIIVSGATNLFAQNAETFKIGVFLDLTGATSSFGISTLTAAQMATDEINASGGVNGRKLELIVEDTQGLPGLSPPAAKKLIEEKKIHILLGEIASSNSLAAAPIAQKAKIPMLSPASTNIKVTEVGDYIFRACFVDPLQGSAMARFAFENLKAKRAAVLFDYNSDYSKGLLETFSKTFIELGGKIVSKQSYTQIDEDFSPELRALKKTKPDVIYIPGYYNQVGTIIPQVRRLKMVMPILGGDGWDSPLFFDLAKKALDNSYITNHFASDSPDEKVKKFVVDYKKRYNLAPDSLSALGYDSVYLLADTFRRANSTEGAKLRDALAQTKNFQGVTGKIEFDASRNPLGKNVVILKTQKDGFIYHATVLPN